MRKFLAVIGLQVIYYLLWAFIFGEFLFLDSVGIRFFYLFINIITVIGISVLIYANTPDFLKDKTHEQKKTGIKKYIGELHEELELYGQAIDLEKKIKEFKSKQ